MIDNVKEIVKLIEDNKWDEARSVAKDSLGALQAINAIKSLTKNGAVEKEELQKIKCMKANFSSLIQSGWLSEFDVDYFTLLFTFIEDSDEKSI
ncbi:MAG: hypothetical protein ACUVQ8_01830 [Nitrososphaeria archaeon]